MTNNFKLLVATLVSTCVIILSMLFYNIQTHNDKMKAYYICLEKQEKMTKEYKGNYSAENLYCSHR
jgi:hypothetical protein